MTDLIQFLKENPPAKDFKPHCYHSKEADALTIYLRGDADYSKRLNAHVTLFFSIDTDEVVGCRIKGLGDFI